MEPTSRDSSLPIEILDARSREDRAAARHPVAADVNGGLKGRVAGHSPKEPTVEGACHR
jgi:hypothetical protein